MFILSEFEARLPAALREQFQCLRSPIEIQRYLDGLAYIGEERDRSPLDVMKDRQCHCLDGGLLAAVTLRRIGQPGLLIDLVPRMDRDGHKLDDDHVLALFRRQGLWGAVAKSNFPWLRYREPVYRNVRELVMSYFEVYCNVDGIKALHGYTRPLDIAHWDSLNYAWDEEGAAILYRKFYARKEIPLISAQSETLLEPLDKLAYDSAFLGTNQDWVFRPSK